MAVKELGKRLVIKGEKSEQKGGLCDVWIFEKHTSLGQLNISV